MPKILAQKSSAATDNLEHFHHSSITLCSLHGSLVDNDLMFEVGEKLADALKENKTLISVKYAQNLG